MREILFRGKRTDNGEWVEGLFCREEKCGVFYPCIEREHEYDFGDWIERIEIDVSTLSQYTGLTDKNGKKIFEGDIVDQNWYDYTEPSDHSFGEVIFRKDDCCFSVMDIEKGYIVSIGRCGSYYWEIEVIGNIHDNPELLKKEE